MAALMEEQDKRRGVLIERLGTVADLACSTPFPGKLGDVAYDLLRQAAAQISSDRQHIARLAHSEPRPVAGDVREGLELLRGDEADPYSFSGDSDDQRLCITQHKFFRWGDDCVIAIGELNYPNQWDDEAFDAKVEALESALKPASMRDRLADLVENGYLAAPARDYLRTWLEVNPSEALATHSPAPTEAEWRTDMDAAKHGGHVVLNSDSPLWRYPFVGFWNAREGWWQFSDPNMAGCFSVSELVNQWSPLPPAPSTQGGAEG